MTRYYDPIADAGGKAADPIGGLIGAIAEGSKDLPKAAACAGCLLLSVGFVIATLLAGCIALVYMALR